MDAVREERVALRMRNHAGLAWHEPVVVHTRGASRTVLVETLLRVVRARYRWCKHLKVEIVRENGIPYTRSCSVDLRHRFHAYADVRPSPYIGIRHQI